MRTLTYSGTLTTVTCWCGMRHAVPTELLREQLAATKRSREATRELLAAEERSHAATRGHLTRTKRRVGSGVCPCCNRSFQQLARHMKAKHPKYVEAAK